MDLQHLRTFVTTAELLHFRRAARYECISQSALSRRIASLERELDVQLFKRGGRRIELTAAGRVLLAQGRSLLEDVDHTVAAVRAMPAGAPSAMTVGFSAGAAVGNVAGLLASFRQTQPDVAVSICTGDWETLLEQLSAGDLDVAFGYLPERRNGACETLPLWQIEFGLLAPAAHPLAHGGSRMAREFSADWIMIPTADVGVHHRDALTQYCRDAGFVPSVDEGPRESRYTMTSVQVAVATERGVAFVPRSLDQLPPNTTMIELAAPPPPLVVTLARHTSNRSPLVKQLVDLARPHMSMAAPEPGLAGKPHADGRPRRISGSCRSRLDVSEAANMRRSRPAHALVGADGSS